MELSIKSLAAAGAFVGLPVKKEIEWFSGGKQQKATIYIRLDSFREMTLRWEDQERGVDVFASRIARGICKKDGTPVFTVDDVLGAESIGRGPLCSQLVLVLLSALNEANGVGQGESEKK